MKIGMILVLVLSLSILPAAHAEKKATSSKEASQKALWTNKMLELYKILVDILVETSSDQKFNSPQNKAQIEKHAEKLASLAHDLQTKKVQSPDADPTVQMISGLFANESKDAYLALKRGNREYARGVLRSITSYCVTCHTRHQSGPEFVSLPLQLSQTQTTASEKGEFYAATRQFDLALAEFQKVIADPKAPEARILGWQRAIHQALAISIRYKKDPDLAGNIVDKVIANPRSPYYLKQNAVQWKKSIEEWKNEGQRKGMTEEGLYAEALRLTGAAHQMQKYTLDRSADVVYLRASAVLHDLLQLAPQGAHVGEAFLMAGLCYEVLKPLNLAELHELYYQACIEKVPHSSTSDLCYRRYEESIYSRNSGSGVGEDDIPADVRKRLKKLEILARPENIVNPEVR